MQVITFCSFKGGTAKTSTTLHLGACLAKYHNKKVLLIDFDAQANLTSGAGLGRDCLEAMPEVLTGKKKINEIIQHSSIPNLDIAPGNAYLDGIETRDPLVADFYNQERLRKCLRGLDYDFCFIDTPPSLGWLTTSAFYASQFYIICATPEPYSLLGLQRLREHHEVVQENHDISVLGVVLTFWSDKGAANSAYTDAIESSFPGKLFETKVRRDAAVNHAILKGKFVVETAESSRVSQDYQALAEEFLKRFNTLKSPTLEKSIGSLIDSPKVGTRK
jgi:chromosome partitioning protein